MEDGHVLVIGSAGIDVKGYPDATLRWGTPNLGRVRNSVGGVARNIAENLALLEVPVVLLSAVGYDSAGQRVLRKCERSGIDCSHVRRIKEARTGTYMALLRPDDKQLQVGISDFAVIAHIDAAYLQANERLFAEAQLLVLDTTLSPDALAAAFALAEAHDLRVAVDPTTPGLAPRLCAHLDQMYLMVPNAPETAAMCDGVTAHDRESAITAARNFVAMGVEIAVVTMGDQGLAYADGNGTGYLRAIQTRVVDPTGAGDAFCAATIFGLLNAVPLDEAMRLGSTAAALTISSAHTVLPTLTQELLYSRLAV